MHGSHFLQHVTPSLPCFLPCHSCLPIFQILPPIWSGPFLRPDQTPMVYALAPPLCSVLSSDIRGCFLCMFVRGHPVPFLYSGNFWEGLRRGGVGVGEGQIQESSGISPLIPSFWGLPTPGSAHYFKLYSCLPADYLLWSRRILPSRRTLFWVSIRSLVQRAVEVTLLALGK